MKQHAPLPRRQLTLLDSVCIIVGIIIGAGIYESSPLIASFTGSPQLLIAAWFFGGLISLMGALCYAELCSTYPEEGGEYFFLRRTYGRQLGLLFGWIEFWIIRPGTIGAMAFVFANYFQPLLPARVVLRSPALVAVLAIVVLSAINLLGLRAGKWTQNVLTITKVLGLAGIILLGFWSPGPPPAADASPAPSAAFATAMIFVLFAFGGWNDLSFVAAEVQHPRKNLLRALVLGILLVTTIYVLVNLAMLYGLGFAGFRQSRQAAADLLGQVGGTWGARSISVLICISSLGAMNGTILTGARIYYAMGTDSRLLGWLGKWDERTDSPLRSLVLQSIATVMLVAVFGQYAESFTRLVAFGTPFFWCFILLVSIAVIILRRREPDRERPYRVHFYPWTPLLFALCCAYLVFSGVRYLGTLEYNWSFPIEIGWALVVLGSGAVVSCWPDRNQADQSSSE